MPSKMLLLCGVPMFVGCCGILWIYWDSFKKTIKSRLIHKKKIFISADCWLSVFELLPPRQLGHGIALISKRFDYYVQEHFKTRRWSYGYVQIWRRKKKTNGTKEMQIFNGRGESMKITQKSLMPKKVIGFQHLLISYIDQNVIKFLRRCSSVFANYGINLSVQTRNDRLLERVLLNVWPLLKDEIRGIILWPRDLDRLRRFGHSAILSDCPSLRIVVSYLDVYLKFPPDDCADASDGQALAKWLFLPRPDGVPKVMKCLIKFDEEQWTTKINGLIAAFSTASSPVNFIIAIAYSSATDAFTVPFNLTNELTGERLTLNTAKNKYNHFLLIRCPIARDENKWTHWEKEALELKFWHQWNVIDIAIVEEEIGDCLIDGTSADPSDPDGERTCRILK